MRNPGVPWIASRLPQLNARDNTVVRMIAPRDFAMFNNEEIFCNEFVAPPHESINISIIGFLISFVLYGDVIFVERSL